MTVAELIAILNEMPSDDIVLVDSGLLTPVSVVNTLKGRFVTLETYSPLYVATPRTGPRYPGTQAPPTNKYRKKH